MGEILPAEGYHQNRDEFLIRLKSVGDFLLNGLVALGDSMLSIGADAGVSTTNEITESEVDEFVRQSSTSKFDKELKTLARYKPSN